MDSGAWRAGQGVGRSTAAAEDWRAGKEAGRSRAVAGDWRDRKGGGGGPRRAHLVKKDNLRRLQLTSERPRR